MKKTVYVGPTIIGVATRNTTYEELPKPLKAAIRQFPYLGNLCVPVSGLAAALAGRLAQRDEGLRAVASKLEEKKKPRAQKPAPCEF